MGFFGALNTLLNEDSNESFEKKMGRALDRVENALQTGLDKAEQGVKQVDAAAERATAAEDKVDNVTEAAEKKINVTDT
jgi:hypothetical protein